MIPHKDSLLSELTFVSFDVETTGLDPQVEKIVEIGAAGFDRGGNLGEYQQLIDPGCPIHPDAVAIHGITDEMVASCPPISDVLPDVVEFFGDSVLIAHNAPFDIGFLDAAFTGAGIEPPKNSVLCTLQLARAVFPGLPGHGLEALVKELRIPPGRRHRALGDAADTVAVFGRCVERVGAGWGTTFGDLLRRHGKPFRFGGAFDPDLAGRPLAMIKDAVEKRTAVRIEYRSGSGQMTTRTISPLSLDERGQHLKVVAFCHLRSERRTFRIDCIKKIDTSGT